ncbi:hypothetical protein NSA48_10880 [Frisingicoccus caecimuris]|uniref:Uncharacterized protein n=1 Tax=Frisingicoccus caecimuris TaxID=1796636 RepID=A0A4R2LVD4_9FIRM|nr:DUF6612 family protein [Frisingicoccus caecimuris]MCR1919538.1 hypothetical protein [Frisingicoccus caecimuris]TCO83899.1 hypothetical protein EV212_11151 [Frisingicoccus caecimuris]
MRKKIVWLLVSVMILSAVVFGGCGKKEVTAESLVKEANENMEKAKSYTGDMDMKMSMNVSSQGVAMDMDMGMQGTIEYTAEPEIVHMKGTMDVSLLGLSMDMDMYSQVEDDKATVYMCMMNEWMKSETGIDESSIQDMYAIAEDGKDMTLAEETEKIGDREVYVLTSTITGEEFQEIMGVMENMTEGVGDMNWSNMQANVTMKIYKDTILPASVSIEMSDSGEGIESEGVTVKFNNLSVVMNYVDFDSVDSIEIPEEALAAKSVDSENILGEEESILESEVSETETEAQ